MIKRQKKIEKGKLLYIFLLVMGLTLTACGTKKEEVKSVETKAATEVNELESDSNEEKALDENKEIVDEEKTAIIVQDNNQEESKIEGGSGDQTSKEDITQDTKDNNTQSDSEWRYKIFKIVNPDEVEYYGESPTFMISYDTENIQISLDFLGSNTFAMYEPDDTEFSARAEVISFSMGGEDGMGVPSDNNSTLELTVDGDKATIIFHTPEGDDSEPINFELIESK